MQRAGNPCSAYSQTTLRFSLCRVLKLPCANSQTNRAATTKKRKRPLKSRSFSLYMAEREGFEPSLGVNLNTLSRRAPSATQPSLRNLRCKRGYTREIPRLLQLLYRKAGCFCRNFHHSPAFGDQALPLTCFLSSAANPSIRFNGTNAFSRSAASTKISCPVVSVNAASIAFKPFIAIQGQ